MYHIATGGEDRCRHADTFYYKYVVKTFVIQAFPVPVQLGKGIVRFFEWKNVSGYIHIYIYVHNNHNNPYALLLTRMSLLFSRKERVCARWVSLHVVALCTRFLKTQRVNGYVVRDVNNSDGARV